MPTYEFRCPQGHEFEKFYRTIGGAEAQAGCPVCGLPAERVMSAAGFAFKGSGFYLTDYGKNAHREKGTPTPAGASSGDGARTEGGKPESTGEPAKTSGGESSSSAPGASGGKPSENRSSENKSSENKSSESKASESKSSEAKAAPAPPKKSSGE